MSISASLPQPQFFPSKDDKRIAIISRALESNWRPGEWDPTTGIFTLDLNHPLSGSRLCVVPSCATMTATASLPFCITCTRRWKAAGKPEPEAWAATAPVTNRRRPNPCVVAAGGERCARPAVGPNELCHNHYQAWWIERQTRGSWDDFIAGARPYAGHGECLVAACDYESMSANPQLCSAHHSKWKRLNPDGGDLERWAARTGPRGDGRRIVLRGLPELLAKELLYALQVHQREGLRLRPSDMSPLVDLMRAAGVGSVAEFDPERPELKSLRSSARFIADRVGLAYRTPEDERLRDVWDLRVFGRTEGTIIDFRPISQPWLKEVAKRWMYLSCNQLSVMTVQTRFIAVVELSEYLARRRGHGNDQSVLGRSEIEGFVKNLHREAADGRRSVASVRRRLLDLRLFLQVSRQAGYLVGTPDQFVVSRTDIPTEPETEETPGRALPQCVIDQLSSDQALAELRSLPAGRSGGQAVLAFKLLRDTGRRISEVVTLRLDCVGRDGDGHPFLIYDNHKGRRRGRHLPIDEATAATIIEQQRLVLNQFPDVARSELVLFPRVVKAAHHGTSLRADALGYWLRRWVDGLEVLNGPERDNTGNPMPFDRTCVTAHAFRHSYAQRHADGGTPPEVLQELMDHSNLLTTQGYYRVGMARKRAALNQLRPMRLDRHGRANLGTPSSQYEEPMYDLRFEVAQVAVPFGLCAEPSNVKSGGKSCPIRYRCTGCDHFSSDPSFLPELRAHLDELQRAREAGLAMGAEEWALVPEAELVQLRTVISRLELRLAELPDDTRGLVETAIGNVRKGRESVPVFFGRRS